MINAVVNIAVEAGALIRNLYQESCGASIKTDGSFLTQADLTSHQYIVSALLTLTPDVPILSEESLVKEVKNRFSWNEYWLVDPLDGTKEFVSGNGEFTVNIALIKNHLPVLGVVYAPVLDTVYWGEHGVGAFKKVGTGQPQKIHVRERLQNVSEWVIVGSRSHQTDEFRSFVDRYPGAEIVSMGSSLKLCMVAEGEADLYPRLGLTSEWDTAAAQAVVEAAGGQVISWPDREPLRYNTRKDTLLNPHFLTCGETI